MEKVIAVIVTHNRQAKLANCIAALRTQTHPLDAILVVNNASTDNTAFWLDNQYDVEHLIQENMGPAGGFKAGIQWAYQRGFTWIWCMEDDSLPAANALEKLIDQDNGQPALINSILVNKLDRAALVHPIHHHHLIQNIQEQVLEGVAYPFNGSLIHRSIVTKVGLPNDSMFIKGAETEYLYRITKQHQIPVRTVVSSIHYANPINDIGKGQWSADEFWKFYFFIKNRKKIFEIQYSHAILAALVFLGFVFKWMARTIFSSQPEKRKKINVMLSAMFHAFYPLITPSTNYFKQSLRPQQMTLVPTMVSNVCKKAYYSIFFPAAYLQQDSMAA